MLAWRVPLGVLLVAVLAASCWLDARASPPGVWLFPLWLCVCTAGADEICRLLRRGGYRPQTGLVVVGVPALITTSYLEHASTPPAFLATWFPLADTATCLALLFCVAVAWQIVRYGHVERPLTQLALTMWSLLYVGLLPTYVVRLRLWQGDFVGLIAVVSVVLAAKLADIGAYTCGRIWGKHKLAPTLSPGKTVEGAIGGLVFAALGTQLFFVSVATSSAADGVSLPAWWQGALYGGTVGVAGMLGDLAESMVKRECGEKDSSRWLPGFGGILDVIDSLVFAAPVAYCCWKWGWITL